MVFSDFGCDHHFGTLIDFCQALPSKKGRTPLEFFAWRENGAEKKSNVMKSRPHPSAGCSVFLKSHHRTP